MKIKFIMPITLPKNGNVSYNVKTGWRLGDGVKIIEHLTLELDLFGEEYSVDNVTPIFKAILAANPDVFEASMNWQVGHEPTFLLTFKKHGQSFEQDPETCEVIYPPQDPVEWATGENQCIEKR